MGTGPDHRGSVGDLSDFAPRFVKARLEGFSKDMKICLTGMKNKQGKTTHAYFPALMSCCATLEYLAGLYFGKTECHGDDFDKYAARFLPQPDYSPDMIRVLVYAFRHPVAHRGIASGVWVDQKPVGGGRRVTWKLGTQSQPPALVLKEETGKLKKDSPWPCSYTHRMNIRLGRLFHDICASAVKPDGLCDVLASDREVLRNFEKVMKQLYPQDPKPAKEPHP